MNIKQYYMPAVSYQIMLLGVKQSTWNIQIHIHINHIILYILLYKLLVLVYRKKVCILVNI